MTAPDEFLAPIRARISGKNGIYDFQPEDAPRLLAALDGVLALHKPFGSGSRYCSYCFDYYSSPRSWPCHTVEAIQTALEGQG